MSKTKRRQGVHPWNPPKLRPQDSLPFGEGPGVASASECTGIAGRPPLSPSECSHIASLLATLTPKPRDSGDGDGKQTQESGERDQRS